MRIAVLAVQGAFIEQERKLEALGASFVELRKKEDLDESYDGLILPGGESTVQGKLLRELGMLKPLKKQIEDGMPVLATCAGMILLAEETVNDERAYFKTMPITVRRNAYGRQLGSFHTEEMFKGIGKIPMTFIRAPYVEEIQASDEREGNQVEVLAAVQEKTVAVRYQNQLALAFHPELDEDDQIHRLFLQMVEKWKVKTLRNK